MPRAAPLKPASPQNPLDPVLPTAAQAAAVKAMFRGDATPTQQQRGMEFIVVHLCGARRRTFDPASPRVTDFAEGMRWVANQLASIRDTLDVAKLKQDAKETEDA